MSEQKPYGVFTTTEYEKDGAKKVFWQRLGTAFKNKDDSFNLLLNALPLPDPKTGLVRLHMRQPKVTNGQSNEENEFYLEIDPIFGAPLEAL